MDRRMEQARGRLLRRLDKGDGTMSVRDAHRWMSNTIDTETRWTLLAAMIENGDIKHRDGTIKITTSTIPESLGRRRKNLLPNSDDF